MTQAGHSASVEAPLSGAHIVRKYRQNGNRDPSFSFDVSFVPKKKKNYSIRLFELVKNVNVDLIRP